MTAAVALLAVSVCRSSHTPVVNAQGTNPTKSAATRADSQPTFTLTVLGQYMNRSTTPSDLNDRGEIVGQAVDAEASYGFYWSEPTGFVAVLGPKDVPREPSMTRAR